MSTEVCSNLLVKNIPFARVKYKYMIKWHMKITCETRLQSNNKWHGKPVDVVHQN